MASAVQSSRLVFHKICVNRKRKVHQLRSIFAEVLVPLYGDQSVAIDKILHGEDRVCYLAYDDRADRDCSTPIGVLCYKTGLTQDKLVEIKSLFLNNSGTTSGKGYGSELWNYAASKMKSLGARGAELTVSELVPQSLAFFLKKGFSIVDTVQDRYIPGAKEYTLRFTFPPTTPVTSVEHKEHKVTLKPNYISLIKSGRKTVEGRIHSGIFAKMREGDFVTFFHMKNTQFRVRCKIVRTTAYWSFDDMLRSEGVQNMLPDVDNISRAVSIYNALPGYAEKSMRHGVIALALELA